MSILFSPFVEEILARIREAGFRIAITKTTKLSEEVAKKFYANCEKKDYYIDLIEHMKRFVFMTYTSTAYPKKIAEQKSSLRFKIKLMA